MSILIFFAVLFVLVLVHEWGHFIVAKKTGMRVDEFAIGFPPKLFGIKKGETEYNFNLLPIGGYVKIFGEDSIGMGEHPDNKRSFVAKSKWAQTAVLIAGVTMNVILAWVLFTAALSIGTQTVVSEGQASDKASLVVTSVLPEGPAASANIPRGARVVEVTSGEDILSKLTPTAFRSFTAEHLDEELTVRYVSGGKEFISVVVPEKGLDTSDPERPVVGVGLALLEVISQPIHLAVYEAGKMTLTGLRDITLGLGKLLYDTVRMRADFSQVAGPVGIVGLVGEASAFGITSLLMFTAFISLNLAVINMLPFPALDGGRLLFVIIEAVMRRPINPKWVAALNTIGFGLLILLMVVVTYNDILKII